ncbi:hypothetical protein [Gulosibacter molinativorax]|uniref:hypothetical protein n=1 Tax=Gulosibacter molinativorax TaxID=256821 RepID=UPI0011B29CC0|nr:hypothetical protein [Gulosibacter molinativorax]QUY62716.1 Hypotetical protein [Gulosibacter molinativorax]
MRQVVVSVAFAISLVLILGTSGCASASPQTETQVTEFDTYTAQLQALPGVQQVDLNASEQTSSVSLNVQLVDDVEPAALAEIGSAVANFIPTAEEHGYVPTGPAIRLDESVYAYFNGLTTEQVQDQLGYWLGLVRTGVNSVQMRTYTSTNNVPAKGTVGAAKTTEQPPRYVLVDLPPDITEESLRSLIDGLAAIKDPGAPGGQWDFLNLAPQTKGEYAEPSFPSTTELSYAVTAGNHFAEVDGLANVEVIRDAGHDTPLQIRIAVFDDAMDGVGSGDAAAVFENTEAWTHLVDLVALLETAGSLDYSVRVLANPLNDGGNFQLDFSVHGCKFEADSTWPELATALNGVWEEHAASARFDADPTCKKPSDKSHQAHPDETSGDSSEATDPQAP